MTRLMCLRVAFAAATFLTSTATLAQQVCDVEGSPAGVATGTASLACGTGAVAEGNYAIAIGNDAEAAGNNSIAIGGYETNAWATNTVAVGFFSEALAHGTTTLGAFSTGEGAYSTALGSHAWANGVHSTAVGSNAWADVENATALGRYARATHENSVALGSNSNTTAVNQVNVGGRTIGGVADGVADDDVATVGQLRALEQNLFDQFSANSSQTMSNESREEISQLKSLVRESRRQIDVANEGVALALALNSPKVPVGSRFALSGGIGGFDGKHGLATAISAAVGQTGTISAGLGYSMNSRKVGYRAGFQFAF